MQATTIIRKPIITEKATAATDQNRYTFEIDRRADKAQVKRAIEELYKVRVVGVSTQLRRGKSRRFKYGLVQKSSIKRAIVRVHAEDRIELF
ncbi:MAG: 50S ribosomal protein L23 [Phycisphaerales bacterium]|nr:50S ribosomal protein L23 [Phycisphaerales bacterium]